ncbi:FtsJ methyltransferase domain-containing protein 2 [Geranomyces variabilis]|uniref:Cap-specific mRNA (nucleoside-2'-O-)-methyltransferase 1 n=1 Tax=Geranomyces variabilis TaxID=109894 RepID=A0AAD5TI58_9FUNG|nr:FtsJ methyltransferase domain-containing protein 2 [Geranomyces variabilis]
MASDDPYSNDPEYLATPLVSPIPPPTPLARHQQQLQQQHPQQYDHRSSSRPEPPTTHRDHRPSAPPALPAPVFRNDKPITHQQPVQWISSDAGVEDGGWLDKLAVVVSKVGELDYGLFCDPDVVTELFKTKTKISVIVPHDLYRARCRANPYEAIGKSVFVNRSAVKMANLDAACGLLRPWPSPPLEAGAADEAGTAEAHANAFTFADICAGPGGFAEYILWRSVQQPGGFQCRGWGMTLRGPQDFALADMNPDLHATERFTPIYGADNTGDIYKEVNIIAFAEKVQRETADRGGGGVDLVTADGGLNVDGDELHQEDHLRQLVLCQVLTMFLTLRKGGDFAIKVFDLYAPFTVQLVYILFRHFTKIAIVKPFTSRPANAERYIVCKSLKSAPSQRLVDHLFAVNARLSELKPDGAANVVVESSHTVTQPGFLPRAVRIERGMEEVSGIMDLNVVLSDQSFMDRIKASNNKLSMCQKEALAELYRYASDRAKPTYDQVGISRRCLQEWKLPVPPEDPQRRDMRHEAQQQQQYRRERDERDSHNRTPHHHGRERDQHRFSPYGRSSNDGRDGDARRDDGRNRRDQPRYGGGGGDAYRSGSGGGSHRPQNYR